MTIENELKKFKKEFDHELKVYLDSAVKEARAEDRFVGGALAYFSKTLLAGGKRLRPAMMYYGYLAGGGRSSKEILKATVSVELVHGFLLMHDDIIDRDDVRHGMPTIHAHYARYAKRLLDTDDAEHFGEAVGIVVGDAVHSLGFNALLDTDFPQDRILASLKKLESVITRTAIGQMQDIHTEYKKQAKESEVLTIYENKTARYTFEGPLQLGMGLAGADQKLIDVTSAAVLPLGIAFQIQDDIIGVFGDQKKTGKPVGSDIVEGKMTVLVVHAYKNANRGQKKILDTLLGIDKESLSAKELRIFQDILRDTGAYDHATDLAQKYLDEAIESIDKIDVPQRPKAFFVGLAQYLHNRTI